MSRYSDGRIERGLCGWDRDAMHRAGLSVHNFVRDEFNLSGEIFPVYLVSEGTCIMGSTNTSQISQDEVNSILL